MPRSGLRGTLIVHGEDYPTQDGSCVRDFVHVSDLADAHLKAVEWLMRQKPDAAVTTSSTWVGRRL